MVNAPSSGVVVSPRASANLKRSLVLAIACGALALVVLVLVGHPLAGLFFVVGLGFGALNTWLVQRSVVRYGETQRKGGFVRSVVFRLALVTVAALAAVYFVRPDGAGLLAGVAVFQVIMLVGATVPLYKEYRRS